MKKRKIGDKALTKKVDHAFRQLFKARTKEMKCFVCGRETDWWDKKTNPNGLQLGHFISRSVFTLR